MCFLLESTVGIQRVLCVSACSVAQLCSTLGSPWAVAHQAPLSMEFSRREYWNSYSRGSSWSEIKLASLVPPALQADSLPLCHLGSPRVLYYLYSFLANILRGCRALLGHHKVCVIFRKEKRWGLWGYFWTPWQATQSPTVVSELTLPWRWPISLLEQGKDTVRWTPLWKCPVTGLDVLFHLLINRM